MTSEHNQIVWLPFNPLFHNVTRGHNSKNKTKKTLKFFFTNKL